ncbi:hypothetical protein CLV56_3538 [Mumia flava]|uniref:Uncharacterized protein n=1 Tax=Mumia flava TaxID=1348852 RepID=A0A0B2BL06_9ACTN|nr:hypothetical protein [Mumia flava]PJJ54035.1 hypothetical protein CLV56_3538 [Mumia flava]
MKGSTKILVAITAMIAIAVLGVGAYVIGSMVQTQRAEVAKQERAAAEQAAQQEERETCEAALRPYLRALQDIDARLDVGMTQADFGAAVGDASVARNRVDTTALSSWCSGVLADADQALTAYTTTNSEWNDCIWSSYCDTDDLDLQGPWSEASTQLTGAAASLRDGTPGTPG